MAVDSLASARFALDVQGLDGLKRAATRDPKAQIKAAATQFEALFLGRMLKSMRDASYKSDLVDNQQIEFYQSLFDQQLAQNLAGKGIGLADMLTRQMSGRKAAPPASAVAAANARMAAIPRATPQSLAGVPPVAGEPPESAGATAAPASPRAVSQLNLYKESAAASATSTPGATAVEPPADQSTAGRFVQRFLGAARSAAAVSGLSPLVILAQAALETGWGKHEVAASDGRPSHNLFGMKTGSGWNGAAADCDTQEFQGGGWLAVRGRFRVYGSDTESFLDHARLLATSPRYAPVRDAATPEQAALALQNCGYATDPRYADKLIAIMREIGPLPAT